MGAVVRCIRKYKCCGTLGSPSSGRRQADSCSCQSCISAFQAGFLPFLKVQDTHPCMPVRRYRGLPLAVTAAPQIMYTSSPAAAAGQWIHALRLRDWMGPRQPLIAWLVFAGPVPGGALHNTPPRSWGSGARGKGQSGIVALVDSTSDRHPHWDSRGRVHPYPNLPATRFARRYYL